MIYLPDCHAVFLHCPKTGGTSVRNFLKANFSCEEGAPWHGDLEFARQWKGEDVRAFTFIRHPAMWLQSYWADRVLIGWGGDLPIAHPPCGDYEFNGFAAKVAVLYPGFVSELLERYAGQPEDPNGPMVGKYINLATDLPRMLGELGIQAKKLKDLPRENAAGSLPQLKQRSQYLPQVYRAVCQSEKRAIDRFGYSI